MEAAGGGGQKLLAAGATQVGGLYTVQGDLLCSVPTPASKAGGAVEIDGATVCIAVLESGALQLTALTAENDRDEKTREALVNHHSALAKAKTDLERVAREKVEVSRQAGRQGSGIDGSIYYG